MHGEGKHNLSGEKKKKTGVKNWATRRLLLFNLLLGEHSCFSRQPLSLSEASKQAYTRLQTRLTVTAHRAFIIFLPPHLHGRKLFYFIFN